MAGLVSDLLLLRVSLCTRKKDHSQVCPSVAVFGVEQDLLGYWREGRKFGPHHVTPLAADLEPEAAIYVSGCDVFLAGKSIGCSDGDTGKRHVARFHRTGNHAERSCVLRPERCGKNQ